MDRNHRIASSAEIRSRAEAAMHRRNKRIAPWAEIRERITDASPEGLAPIDQLHSEGLAATRLLAKLARITKGEKVLDVGCSVGGPARLLAGEFGAVVTGVDFAGGLIEVAQRLVEVTGIPVTFQCADALQLPFDDASFDVVWTQHAASAIADKPRLYSEIRRVLRTGGRLAMHDLMQGSTEGTLYMPVPCADSEDETFLAETGKLKSLLSAIGFRELVWHDRTAATKTYSASPFSIHLIKGEGFPEMLDNLRRNLQEGRITVAMGVFQAI